MLDGSRSVFGPEALTDELQARLAAFDIHPSGPLWGGGELRSSGAVREIELVAASPNHNHRRSERRSLILSSRDASTSRRAPSASFSLLKIHRTGSAPSSSSALERS